MNDDSRDRPVSQRGASLYGAREKVLKQNNKNNHKNNHKKKKRKTEANKRRCDLVTGQVGGELAEWNTSTAPFYVMD